MDNVLHRWPARFRLWMIGGIIAVVGGILASTAGHAADLVAPVKACDVDVTPRLSPQLELDVAVSCAVTRDLTLRAPGSQMARFVSQVRDTSGGKIDYFARDWTARASGSARTSIRYRFDLDGFLNESGRITTGLRRGETRLALLENWLLQPVVAGLTLPVAIRVEESPDMRFATGLAYSGGRWHLGDVPVRFAGYTVFGRFELVSVPVVPPGALASAAADSAPLRPAAIDLVFMEGDLVAGRARVADWVKRSAAAIANYFDGYSAAQSLLVLVPAAGSGLPYGRVVPGGGISMAVQIGQASGTRALYDEWVLIHEMIHTATPFIYGRGTWLMEGLATYLEPVIRARAGWKTEADVWHEWMVNMDRGLEALTVTGLHNNASSGGYYWGGALFMLLADIGIRRATDLRLGLEDCLRAITQRGGNAVERWSVEEMLGACDRETGVEVMADLNRRFVDGASPLELSALWRDLGVDLRDGVVVYDDSAPFAGIRRLIVKGPVDRRGRQVPLGSN